MFRPYLSEHVRPNTPPAAAAAADGVKKLLEFPQVMYLQANACGPKRVRSCGKEMT
jgi:hypothetical protein